MERIKAGIIGLITLAGEYEFGFEDAPILHKKVREVLSQNGFDVVALVSITYNQNSLNETIDIFKGKDIDAVCICLGTWSEDNLILELMEYVNKPLIIWAFPAAETGSLCGAQQICCVLKELGMNYFFVYGEPDDKSVIEKIYKISKAAALKTKLKNAKIGSIGGRVKGMTEIAFDEFEIKDKTGVIVVNLDESELLEAYYETNEENAREYWKNLKLSVRKTSSSDRYGIESVRYYFAIKKLILANNLSGICIKCYTKYMGKICLGYSLLSEEGIVCGCEGDVTNTVSMKMLYELTNRPIYNTDLMSADKTKNTMLFSHCGSGGFSIANKKEDIHLAPVRLANSGVCALFPAKPGKVTLLNMVGRRGTFRMSVITGEAIACGMEFPGNPLKVMFENNIDDIIKKIAEEGIGHHWMAGYEDVSAELEIYSKIRNIKFYRL